MNSLTEAKYRELLDRGFERSKPFDTEQAALAYCRYLEDLDRNMDLVVSVGGIWHDRDGFVVIKKLTSTYS